MGQVYKAVENFLMGGFFPDNAFLTHFILSGFKLGLDQAENLPCTGL